MFVVQVELKQSTIHGLGCFAAERIEQGQLVWSFDPRVDSRIPFTELSTFPPVVQQTLKKWTFVETRDGQKVMVLCGDHAKFMNHSDTPNVFDSEDKLEEYASRDIEIGEEITCNYYDFDEAADEKFKPTIT